MDVFPIILAIHLIVAISLVGVILLQRSEGGALGIGGSAGGGLMSGRAAGNLLTRTTAILAGTFFVTSLSLSLLANSRSGGGSAFDKINDVAPVAAPAAPAAPAEPSAPLAR
ncbi:preprotein translocase subunit SecG [Paramagnetospirillum kuznetsovii]|uniref:Protein-export membrane protein SecG n=1 Tax=Paramagnetospirillum kuznetsovii TaxID=2053833 RepID=A0A364NZB2_9PROT|nr:preprotein translocase subunit SecG [Paramagnetospirillum kuznetsovii]RAU22414.1 preprotein translocase subunit SecG [Paramagnetospirillum kuznetsovii]